MAVIFRQLTFPLGRSREQDKAKQASNQEPIHDKSSQ
jgi:hypothetical protein